MSMSLQNATSSFSESSALRCRGLAGLLLRLREEHGGMVMENAMGFLILMSMVMGIMECCMMAYDYSVLTEAAREGVRYASVHGSDNTSGCSGPSASCDDTATNVVNDIKAYAATYSGNFGGMHVSVSYPDGLSTGTSRVQISLSLTYTPVFYRFGPTPTITATSSGRILY